MSVIVVSVTMEGMGFARAGVRSFSLEALFRARRRQRGETSLPSLGAQTRLTLLLDLDRVAAVGLAPQEARGADGQAPLRLWWCGQRVQRAEGEGAGESFIQTPKDAVL